MILFPAIDLKDGQCVRLLKGDMNKATVFNDSPGRQAGLFVAAGCRWLHVVDLNGAFAGQPVNEAAVEAIITAAGETPVQLGGGIRDLSTIEFWLEKGVARVILGTVALRDPELVRKACTEFPGRIAVGIDARDGMVAVEGWAETSRVTALDLALRFEDAGVDAIIHTDIDRDGVLKGPNLEATAALAESLTTPVILSGGISSLEDVRAVAAQAHRGIIGAISGRALYDGRLDLHAAVAMLHAADTEGSA
ncbi:1-(5-phosphoribosyl)-5-[(5-phosphoribosylamino)methylideneamino]imidazole-4-carboxamide isomerase [Roseospira marina]|uniref:1-(5-phosphoribosyl)-5-[(5-phosphoribosylamino)methylideneamino] imidazole-4-carboxamide isomerase n=1 Tax=Roseospira marina TaxID=140057 RepID=A0A5M6I6X6_9PROT|nr:1-(5-phosphoribosyl)-5-[(5-phosphoribosylamino)methylideneamino]imidazole-4-carboxamide isomerase [Roseospira marina]KAA5603873.1 1-(5-phosphoribosyl)-5-[(5-phosphoribosylamino)methylideneamino]imidazole-4-carboxamide isomerase [Roseospira marina]MBB4313737.1 phosphoribosylformimino-5-aminoimidazole carboxamide ribotide isomerase [Roseospira marina]MBB5086899.1 phosphoribosylformimino-5-aminoimidazole carboxamide ribotide isomerase [Roseospira marina]